MFVLSIGVLIALSLAAADSGGRTFLVRYAKLIFWSTVVTVAAVGAYTIWQQRELWASDELAKLLLPEYQGSYFYFYILTRIVAPYLIAFIFSLILLAVVARLNKRGGDRFFEVEESYLAATSIFLVAYPGVFFYFLLLFSVYTFWHLWERVRGRRDRRLPLYGLWAPVGLATFLLAQYWLATTPLWLLLKI
ncbi:MAG: hypothetical protein U1C52_00975 [Patescibacteria group bacterium]|nr:hypothetical protein [Patescibacteria group bacterium]